MKQRFTSRLDVAVVLALAVTASHDEAAPQWRLLARCINVQVKPTSERSRGSACLAPARQ